MTNLPTRAHLTDSARTKAEAKSDIGDVRDVVAEIGGKDSWASSKGLTIASGAIVPTCHAHTVDTESGAASDDLTTITTTNIPEGRFLWLFAANASHAVVVKHAAGGAGQIHLATDVDFTLNAVDKALLVYRSGNDLYEAGRCWGADKTSAQYLAYYNLGTASACNTGTGAGNVPVLDGSARLPAVDGSLLTNVRGRPYYIKVREKQLEGVSAGTPGTIGYNKRLLNELEVNEVGAGVSLASNQITLPAGTYYYSASAPAYAANEHKLRLYSTDAGFSVLQIGQVASAELMALSTTIAVISGKFTLGSSKTLELQHWFGATYTNGFGRAIGGGGIEVYATIEIWKV